MAGPNILNAGSDNTQADTDTTFYEVTDVATTTSVTATAPASAKTAIVLVGIDKGHDESLRINSAISWGSLPRIADLEFTPTQASDFNTVRVGRAAIFDLSNEGAVSATLSFGSNETSTANAIFGVVCTDGYVQSATFQPFTTRQGYFIKSYTSNASNCGLLDMTVTDGSLTMTARTGTELFEKSNSTGIAPTAYYQSTVSNDQHTIEVTPSGNQDCVTLSALLTTMPDAFGGLTGKLTSPLLK